MVVVVVGVGHYLVVLMLKMKLEEDLVMFVAAVLVRRCRGGSGGDGGGERGGDRSNCGGRGGDRGHFAGIMGKCGVSSRRRR